MKLRKLVAISMSILIALVLVPKQAGAAETQRPADVIIMIDNSKSLEGSPFETEQQAAKRFCAQYNGRVAIIAVHGSSTIVQNFTNDKGALADAIDGISVGNGTDLNSGLKLAKMLVEDYARSDASCILIVMSDGISNQGDRYEEADGKYNQAYQFPRLLNLFSDGRWQYYASAVYNTAKSLVGCEVVGVRFLPNTDSHDPNEIALGRDVMRDISTLGCLDVASVDDLDAVAILLANTLNTETDNNSIRQKITEMSENLKDPTSQEYIFGHDYLLPYDYSLGLLWSIRLAMPVSWNLDLFNDSASYNYNLAKVTMTLCDNRYDNIGLMEQNLRTLGFDNIVECYPPDDVFHSAHFAIAHQKITINGVEKNLVIIVASGTSGDNEWLSDFSLTFGDNQDYDGFSIPARTVINTLHSYQIENGLSTAGDDNIYILTGHSRGGGIMNLTAKELAYSGEALADQMFDYPFGCPNTTQSMDAANYPFIHNTVDGLDPVTRVPPYAWRYGTTYGYGTGQLQQMIDYHRQDINPVDLTSMVGVAHHFPDYYMRWLSFGAPATAWEGRGWYYASIDCSVDVVAESDGAVVAKITDGQVDASVSVPDCFAWTVGYGKRLMLPDDREYKIVITATGDGTMDYSAVHLGSSPDEDEIAVLIEGSYQLATGDEFSFRLDGTASELDQTSLSVAGPIQSFSRWEILAIWGGGILFGIVAGALIFRLRPWRGRK
ncbi:hypothetical protein FACS189431_0860 [Alphaproteobacteria bacterium]|nr:hypothetical protein FACS189431_0860 [Alphaproteobacteria bacterium]